MAMVSTLFDPEVPWSGILQRITCAQCHFVIPAHLAERWNGISVKQARQQWREVYRADAWQEDMDRLGEDEEE